MHIIDEDKVLFNFGVLGFWGFGVLGYSFLRILNTGLGIEDGSTGIAGHHVHAARRRQTGPDYWLSYASRSRLAPFVKLARTIRHYRTSIEATLEWEITNGISESNNAAIGRIRSAARGFHDPESFITMIMLDRAGIAPQLRGRPHRDPREEHKTEK